MVTGRPGPSPEASRERRSRAGICALPSSAGRGPTKGAAPPPFPDPAWPRSSSAWCRPPTPDSWSRRPGRLSQPVDWSPRWSRCPALWLPAAPTPAATPETDRSEPNRPAAAAAACRLAFGGTDVRPAGEWDGAELSRAWPPPLPIGTSTRPLRSAAVAPIAATTAQVAAVLTTVEPSSALPAPTPAAPATPLPAAPEPAPNVPCRIAAEAATGSGAIARSSPRRRAIDSWNARQSAHPLQVGLDLPPPHDPAIGLGDRPDHLIAPHLTPRFHLAQADPGLVHGLAGRVRRGVERGADLGELEVGQLAHHERGTLALRQLAEVVDQPPEPLPGLGGLDQPRPRGDLLRDQSGGLPPPPDRVDRLVAGDPVDPGPQLDLPLLAGQGPQHLDHRRLKRVLGVLPASDQRQAEPVDVLVVALEDRLERPPVARLGAPDEPLVRLQPGQAWARALRRPDCGGFHVFPVSALEFIRSKLRTASPSITTPVTGYKAQLPVT